MDEPSTVELNDRFLRIEARLDTLEHAMQAYAPGAFKLHCPRCKRYVASPDKCTTCGWRREVGG